MALVRFLETWWASISLIAGVVIGVLVVPWLVAMFLLGIAFGTIREWIRERTASATSSN